MPKKKIQPRGDMGRWIRTGGAIGETTMEELDRFNREGAGVDSTKCKDIGGDGGDPNSGVHLLGGQKSGSEDGY